jgi:hypothetical protein
MSRPEGSIGAKSVDGCAVHTADTDGSIWRRALPCSVELTGRRLLSMRIGVSDRRIFGIVLALAVVSTSVSLVLWLSPDDALRLQRLNLTAGVSTASSELPAIGTSSTHAHPLPTFHRRITIPAAPADLPPSAVLSRLTEIQPNVTASSIRRTTSSAAYAAMGDTTATALDPSAAGDVVYVVLLAGTVRPSALSALLPQPTCKWVVEVVHPDSGQVYGSWCWPSTFPGRSSWPQIFNTFPAAA